MACETNQSLLSQALVFFFFCFTDNAGVIVNNKGEMKGETIEHSLRHKTSKLLFNFLFQVPR